MTTESGLLVVDKASAMTSHDVVSRVRRLAGTRKVGHAGTLDPMATGVLVVGINRATRLLGHLTLTEKAYQATVRLGQTTDTDDADGATIASAPADLLDENAVRAAFDTQVGELDQVPTSVSAVKIGGRRAYERVRAGEDVVLPPRRVTIHDLVVHDLRPIEQCLDVDISVRCSSGTYVRAIARDVGEALGVGGHLSALRRTAVGPFGLDQARTLEDLEGDLGLLPIEEAARACFPALEVGAVEAAAVRVGRPLDHDLPGTTAVFDLEGRFMALYASHGGAARPVAVFVS